MMSLSRGRGRIRIDAGRAFVSAWCPLCGKEHRYDKGDPSGPEIEEIRARGSTDEWMPCQGDLPGNFWRIVISGSKDGGRPGPPRRRRGAKAA
jgi:hypothetical protein